MKTDPKALTDKHTSLIHSEGVKAVSHVQREEGEWIRHTIMLEGYDVPFIFRRKGNYRSLKGATVNLTYYRYEETVAGIEFEQMKVVRIKRA
ncbi:hypothetical protein [Salinimonas iocasae]|uniref:Uncharacterized protein n=1 Tax=Salinimonas iocasae TaxID=2572577 RepID=A0A5B7YGN6_9ALTE|nr:hypothetical protein [Salinimonas iocasae]QCZ94520.1 hypothetical protein FBQ74_14050 [Salinimonas iocasae]